MDFELMHTMRWSWDELRATPPYVRRYCWDFIQLRRAAENAAHERAKNGRS